MIILNKVFLDSTLESLLSRPVLTCCGFSRSKQPGRSQSERWYQGQYWVPREPGSLGVTKKPSLETWFWVSVLSSTFSTWGPAQITTSQEASFYLWNQGWCMLLRASLRTKSFWTGRKGAGHNFWKYDIVQGHNINQLESNGSKMVDKSTLRDPQSAS